MKGHHRMAEDKSTTDRIRVPRRSAVKRVANIIGDTDWRRAELLVDEQVASGNLRAFCMYGTLNSDGNKIYLSETIDLSSNTPNPLEISQNDWKKIQKNTGDDGGEYVDHEERVLGIGSDDRVLLYGIFFCEDDFLEIDWASSARDKQAVESLRAAVFALADKMAVEQLPSKRGDQKRFAFKIAKQLEITEENQIKTVERYVVDWKRGRK
jgi:hypothetical protein